MACCIVMLPQIMQAQQRVTIAEKPLVLPTYQIAPPDKNPVFYTGRTYQGARGDVYPHPMYDVLTDTKKDQAYKAVYIENEYTELCVVPELGGRILSAFDKTDQFDFVYRQHVVKPALIGMIGAWMSGGVEWNIPDHHRATSQLPIDYITENNPDGSKTVWVGETELSRRLQWRVGLTIYPGRSYIEATVKVINTTPFIQPFLYWANLSVHSDENYQVIFPPSTQFGVQHAKNEFTTWPIGSNNYGGVDRRGTDLSWWKNHPNPASIFAWNFTDDFVAGYDHKKQAGTVHIANHQVVGGKKFFLWGNNPEAQMWEKMLTDSDGQYLELMTGAYSDNQPDYSWIGPGETRTFKQYWYPVKRIAGIKKATIDAAMNMERKSSSSLTIGLNATGVFKNAQLLITAGDRVISDTRIDIDPATPFVRDFALDPSINDTLISAKLLSGDGHELVAYQPVQLQPQPMPKPIERPRPPKSYTSNEELYLTGLRIEQFRNATIDPLPYYQEALSRDSLDYRVNTVLGIRASREGRLEEAASYLQQAIKRLTKDYTKPKDGEAFYYAGIVQQLQHRYTEAADNFWKATWYNGFQSAAFFRLAQIACIKRDYKQALELTSQAISGNSRYTAALALKAFVLRKLQDTTQAGMFSKEVLDIDPLDHWAASEKYFANSTRVGASKWDASDVKDFKFRCGGNVQSVLELALLYSNIGAYEEALQVLTEFRQLNEAQSGFPLLFYYQGFFQNKLGDLAAAKASFAEGEKLSPDYCFPFRVEEIEILNTALRQDNSHSRAHYYLGNVYYFLEQKEKALVEWQYATDLDDQFSLAFRNLGFAYSQVSHDTKKAISSYEKAIALNSEDSRLFVELDVLKEQDGVPAKERLQLLEKNLATVEKRDDAVTRLTELYNITGQYDRAISILTKRHFHVWEGGGNIHNTFVDAYLLSGVAKMKKKQYAKAIIDFKEALKYPDNLEVGEPYSKGRSIEINYFIAQAYVGSKNMDQAKLYYQKIIADKSSGTRSKAGFYKALAMQKLEQVDEASTFLDRMIENTKGQLKTTEGLDFFSKFGTANSKESRLSDNYFTLGLAYFGKGDNDLAKQQFAKAIELNQNNVWAKVFLDMKAL